MGRNQTPNEAYEEYKNLTPDQREYEQFRKLHEVYEKVCNIEKKYAAKWVQRVMEVGFLMIVIAFLSVLIKLVMGPTAEIVAWIPFIR